MVGKNKNALEKATRKETKEQGKKIWKHTLNEAIRGKYPSQREKMVVERALPVNARKGAFLKAKLEESALRMKPSIYTPHPSGSSLCRKSSLLKKSFAKGIAYFLQGVPGMLHLLGRIRFSKSSRDTAHCEK